MLSSTKAFYTNRYNVRVNQKKPVTDFESHMNVDKTELLKFNRLAQKWWDPDGEFRSLHALNPLRLQWIESLTLIEGKKILDVGCGGGILSEAMAQNGAHVTGIDLATEAIDAAREHGVQNGLRIDYRLISAENLADQEANAYDIVTCLEMLEHVPDPRAVVQACSRLVKPGGSVFFATLNRNLKSFIYAIAGAEYIMRLLPKGTHRYDRFLTPAKLSQWVREAKMDVTAMTGISANMLGSHFYLSRDMSVNYMMTCTRRS